MIKVTPKGGESGPRYYPRTAIFCVLPKEEQTMLTSELPTRIVLTDDTILRVEEDAEDIVRDIEREEKRERW